jgi:hypothetical protein
MVNNMAQNYYFSDTKNSIFVRFCAHRISLYSQMIVKKYRIYYAICALFVRKIAQ